MKQKIILWFIVLLLTTNLALSVGIRPAKTNIVYEETPTFAGSIWVVNNDKQDLEILITPQGSLSKYITLSTEELTLNRNEDFKEFYFEVELPNNLPPGETLTYILIEQKLKSSEEGFVNSKLVLKHKIFVQGPYPEKFITTKLNFHESGDKVRLVSEVENKGKLEITNLQTKFYVNDKEQNEQILETEETTLQPEETKLLDTNIEKSLFEVGEFEVLAVTTYDDKSVELVKKLVLGTPEVEVTYFDKYFIANRINQYSLDLLNKWNKELKNVYVDVEVKKNGEKIEGFRTKSVDLQGHMAKRINDYFNTQDKGKYSFDMIVNFWNSRNNQMEKKTFESEIISDKDFNGIDQQKPLVGATVVSSVRNPKGSLFLWIIIVVIISSLLSTIIWKITRGRKDRMHPSPREIFDTTERNEESHKSDIVTNKLKTETERQISENKYDEEF